MINSNQIIICTATTISNMHDFELLKRSKLPIRKETKVLVDMGYIGIKSLHANVEIPKKKLNLID